MLVTPVKRNFNQHKLGSTFELPDKAARILIRAGKVAAATLAPEVESSPEGEISPRTGRPKRQYNRRDMVAES